MRFKAASFLLISAPAAKRAQRRSGRQPSQSFVCFLWYGDQEWIPCAASVVLEVAFFTWQSFCWSAWLSGHTLLQLRAKSGLMIQLEEWRLSCLFLTACRWIELAGISTAGTQAYWGARRMCSLAAMLLSMLHYLICEPITVKILVINCLYYVKNKPLMTSNNK